MGGKSKETTTTDKTVKQEREQQAFATPAEERENIREEARLGRIAPLEEEAQTGAFNITNAILTGFLTGKDMSGLLGGLAGGISPETIGTQAARTAQQAQPGFQSLGIADSGVAFEETARDVAESVLFPAEQFNINNLFNLLQTGLSGQSALQSQVGASRANLGSRLAGLRRITGTGETLTQGTTTVLSPNAFTSALATSAGGALGKGLGGSLAGGITGGIGNIGQAGGFSGGFRGGLS